MIIGYRTAARGIINIQIRPTKIFDSYICNKYFIFIETPNHEGKSFLLAFLEMDNHKDTCAIYVTSSAPSEIHITIPFLNKTITRYATPGTSTPISLSTQLRMQGFGQENKGILLTANTTVSVYATNARKSSRDVHVIFPTSTLGNEYVVTTYEPKKKSLAGIIALQDNTLVQIKLRLQENITYMGKVYNNGDILRIFLNRLQTFQLQHHNDLTGTFVVSTGPVAVLGGNICAEVPKKNYDCSHMSAQLVPVSKWGTQFITSPIAGRMLDGDHFRIVAAFDHTDIIIHGKMNFSLNAGEFKEFKLGETEARFVECSKPVTLLQYNKGSADFIQSDPFVLMVPPVQQYANSYYLPIPVQKETPAFLNHIIFIAKTVEFSSISFDTSKFCKKPIEKLRVASTNYTVYSCELRALNVSTVIPISHTSKGGRVVAYMVGHTDMDGYGYLGGMGMRDVNCLRLFQNGVTKGNGCDGRNTTKITSCDPTLTPPITNIYLNGSEISYKRTTKSCRGVITRTYSFRTPNGSIVIAAKHEIHWTKPKPIIRFQTPTRVSEYNLTDLEKKVPGMSSLCNGDSLQFNDTSTNVIPVNGTRVIERVWKVHEGCGRVTTANQTIIGKI